MVSPTTGTGRAHVVDPTETGWPVRAYPRAARSHHDQPGDLAGNAGRTEHVARITAQPPPGGFQDNRRRTPPGDDGRRPPSARHRRGQSQRPRRSYDPSDKRPVSVALGRTGGLFAVGTGEEGGHQAFGTGVRQRTG